MMMDSRGYDRQPVLWARSIWTEKGIWGPRQALSVATVSRPFDRGNPRTSY